MVISGVVALTGPIVPPRPPPTKRVRSAASAELAGATVAGRRGSVRLGSNGRNALRESAGVG